MIGLLYRLLTGGLEPLAGPFLPADRRAAFPSVAGGAWIHAASAGEVRGVVTLARRLLADRPLLLSAQTAAGVALATRAVPEAAVRRAPLDFPGAWRRAVRAAQPGLYVLTETELWPNALDALAGAGVPLALVNARISDRTIGRYRRLRALIAPRLGAFELVAAQSATDAERLRELGARDEALVVAGNMKHDADAARVTPVALPWGDDPVIVLGSARPGEAARLAGALTPLLRGPRAARLVVAPRHLHYRDEAARAFGGLDCRVGYRSAGGPRPDDRVLILDTMGELLGFYAAARLALVGGTFEPFGGHNLIEPASLGVPVLHGPHTQNCRLEADALAATGGGASFAAGDPALGALAARWLAEDAAHATAAAGAREAVRRLAGATERVVGELLRRNLWPPGGARRGARG